MRHWVLLFFLILSTGVFAQHESAIVDLSGNGYVTSHHDGALISSCGLTHWTDPKSVISIYFYVHQPEKARLSLLAKGHSVIKVSYEHKNFKVKLNSDTLKYMSVGTITIKNPGYVKIDIQGLEKAEQTFGEIKSLTVANLNGKVNYVHSFSDYWGRRGPSVHLAYELPEGDTEWFYNEVTVPAEGETLYSYYMTAGFKEGYFGMQYNSPTERRVLFSVWSPFDTQDPRNIPDDQKIKLLRRGEDVHIGEFGNEGSGGQSYLVYPWKAGETYKFLMHVKPQDDGSTAYTAYFCAPDENHWRLIAGFERPMTCTWYKHAHSFLENFIPEQGYLSRKVMFGNQWARSTDGKWTRITKAKFTHDATGGAQVRLDYQGGETDDNRFYLKMGGFFNEAVPMGTVFKCELSGQEPKIDFDALEKL